MVIASLRGTIVPLAVAIFTAHVACADATAAQAPEQQLAARYAPVVALKKQRRLCGKGEGYRPVLVDVVLGRADVSLFDGSGGRYRRLRRAPTAANLFAGPFEHYLDLPGHPVTGACSYERWFKRIGATAPNAVYAHVATEPGRPGRLALQYWLYYVYNDYNDKHESDWEMIQLHFDADTVREALATSADGSALLPARGRRRGRWGERSSRRSADRTSSPTRGPARTRITFATRSGSDGAPTKGSAATTRPPPPGGSAAGGPRPRARAAARPEVRLDHVRGPLGPAREGVQRRSARPEREAPVEQPFTWAESVERKRSFSISSGEHVGLDASALFCSGVTGGERPPRRDLRLEVVDARPRSCSSRSSRSLVSRTRWRPAPVRPLEQRRAGGQILRASFGVYRLDWRTLFVVSAAHPAA